MGFMWISGVVVVVVIVVLIYFLFKVLGTGGFGSTSKETPLDILKKRYSRGEITKEQFEEMKKDL
jgi:putative membrane protein